jgi:hypothetical protein
VLGLLAPLVARATPPPPNITSRPQATTKDTSANFVFSHGEETVNSCKLDNSAFATCTTPTTQTYTGLSDGLHMFAVRASDATGDSAPDTWEWTVDTKPPDTAISSGPPPVTSSGSATFNFSSSEAGSTFECRLDGGAFASCGPPHSYNALPNGRHVFRVRATDAAGNTDPEPGSWEWTIDRTIPPPPTITSGPATPTSERSARFEFSGSGGGLLFLCRLDQRKEESCKSPKTYQGLSDGAHTFTVRARNAAGTTGEPATWTWTVDTVPPDTAISSGPPPLTKSGSATFSFSSTEHATFVCSLDGGGYAACPTPQAYGGLAPGVHAFRVRATDAARNTDATPASAIWTVDTRGPTNVSNVARVVRYRLLKLTWKSPADEDFDHVVVRVGRNPKRQPRTPVYTGAGTSYRNSKFQNGSYYRYAITSYDRLGNASRRVAVVVPASALLTSPRAGAAVQRPPLLDWASVPKATFYNVQLWIGSKKVLTAWPNRSRFKVRRAWSYRRAINRLKRGRYQWYVWPGFGQRSKARYGQLLGQSSFVVKR